MAERKSIYLIDGSAVVYRAFFAFIRAPLINGKGENTSATFGFINSILKVIKEEKPDYLAIVFDTKHPTFRHERYTEYKSTRAKMPDELVEQLPRIQQAVKVLNIPSFEMPGYEADDIIGTIAKAAEAKGFDVWCVTGDKDYFQLVSDNVHIYTPRKVAETPEKIGREEVKVKFGVYPEQVIEKLALMGDSSDNVPGIPGIGPKAAETLLAQFSTVEEIIAHADQIPAKGMREKVIANSELALLSKELVTIHCQVPIEFDIESLKRRAINYEETKAFMLEMEFRNLLQQLIPEAAAEHVAQEAERAQRESDYRTIATLPELEELVKRLQNARELSIDTETTSVNPLLADLVGISISEAPRTGYYIPVGHNALGQSNIRKADALAAIKPLFENKAVQKFGQNIKYDYQVLKRNGIDVNPISFDTMLASYVLSPSERQHSLDHLAFKYCDHRMQPITELIGAGKNQITFDKVAIDKATYYSVEDADFTYRLRAIFAPKLEEQNLANLYYNIELPLISVLASMEAEGIKVDTDFLARLSTEMQGRIDEYTKQIYEIAGGKFNINSTQQLSHILFEKLGLPTKGKTAKKTGFSTDVTVLEELANLHEFPRLILKFRQLGKLKSTYIDALPELVNPNTGRVHTTFNQTIAATGRLSSTDPNLQNIPIRTDDGREIRKAFVPRDADHILLAADYSQIELRILAHYSQDAALIDAFHKGQDIHSRTAAEVFDVPLDQVTSEQRRTAKTCNFAIIYGVTAFGLSQQTGLTRDAAQKFIDKYFERYPGIRGYIDATKKFAVENGYVTTLFNRRRYLPEIADKNFSVRSFAERTAINTPIQGTAADIIKLAMIKIHNDLAGLKSRMVLQVHDELIFDVHKPELPQVTEIVRKGMEKAAKLNVPLIADIGSADNWLDAK
ncbi:MAG: DNA polymerase I [Candidatus Zixiibacteriota bacterium]